MAGVYDMTLHLIEARAGLGAGRAVARGSWLRTLDAIRQLPERPG